MTALDELITRYEETTASTAPTSRAELAELRQRAEAAESRAMTAESHNDSLRKEVEQWRIHVKHVEQERADLRRQLAEAQHAIDAMAQIVGAADTVKRQLEQARSDIEDYRAEIERLTRKVMTA